jgi:hypothetical protein
LDGRLGGSQSRSGDGGEEENSQPLPGLEPPIIQPVTQRYPGSTSRTRGNIKILDKWQPEYEGELSPPDIADIRKDKGINPHV